MRFPKPALVLAIAAGMTLSACGSDSATKDIRVAGSELSLDKTVLVADSSGVEVSQAFFPDADKVDSVVVAGGTAQHRWEGAQEAIKRGIPLLVDDSSNTEAINAEIERLGVKDVVRIGDPVADAQQVAPVPPAPDHPTDTSMARQITEFSAEHGHLDGGAVVLVSQATSAASVATAKASGATVEYLSSGDPRESATLQKDAHAKVLGLGPSFSNQERFHRAVDMLQGPEVPGGGHLIFPEHRLVALYGHPSGGALGVMGEQPAPEAVAKVKELTDHYAGIDPQTTTVPAFEIIATVASADPGPDGNYSNEGNIEELGPWVDEIGKAGGYAVLDLQPGSVNFFDQAKQFEELLKLPHVGLALDPEWRINPGEKPMERVGSVEAAEINSTAEWLAGLVRDNNLPQKPFVVHQFQWREQLNTTAPELAWILHADGHGPARDKFATWEMVQQDLQVEFTMAWKNFVDEDTPMFTPEQTMDIYPRPGFISYQ
ncbi:hypothetical protein ABMV07_00445 [Corynebacterium belfantii]|uniref:hypothetical protein n=1 Tax=Corynebacterium belfantii TaxID=2014537 RepID=UPI0035A8412C